MIKLNRFTKKKKNWGLSYRYGFKAYTLCVANGALELVSGVLGEDMALVVEAGRDPVEAAEGALLLPVEGVGLGVVEPQMEAQRQLVVAQNTAERALVVRLLGFCFVTRKVFDVVIIIRDAFQDGG